MSRVLLATCLVAVVVLGNSCTVPVQAGPHGEQVEELERQAPVTSPPDIREGEAARAAAYYSSDRGGYYGGRNHGGHSRHW